MPYTIKKVKGGYQVASPTHVHSRHTTKEKAMAQLRLLQMIEHGGKSKKK